MEEHAINDTFHVVTESDLHTFLHWDLDYNTLLTVAHLILEQSNSAVRKEASSPIGRRNFCCMWKESPSLHQYQAHTVTRRHAPLKQQASTPPTPNPNPDPVCAETHTAQLEELHLTLIQPAAYRQTVSSPLVAELTHMKLRWQAAMVRPETVFQQGM